MSRQLSLPALEPWFFDFFAGGGGASEGVRLATGKAPDVAINHDARAIDMHQKNHPTSLHLQEDVWKVSPSKDLPDGPCWGAWFSPDCTHFSRARGAKPTSKRVRGLAWVMLKFAAARRPEVLFLENVAEFRSWGPLTTRRTKRGTKRRPIRSKAGVTYARFLAQLRGLGYVVETEILDAADYGAPTHRRRLVLVARRDGRPIVWPDKTHGPGRAHPYRTASECIDWTIPMLSIFASKEEAKAFGKEHGVRAPKRPLAKATKNRIAEGVRRFVLENPKPFLVQVNHGRDTNRSRGLDEPMPTIATKHGFGVVVPFFAQKGQGERQGQLPRTRSVERPYSTAVAGGEKQWLVGAFLAKHNGKTIGQKVDAPCHTLVGTCNKAVVAVHLASFHGEKDGRVRAGAPIDAPLPTQTVAPRFGVVATFLTRYFGKGVGSAVDSTSMVEVQIGGETYALMDIAMRMLTPRELATCQGFPADYVLTGTQAEQVARVGNSVPPQLAEAVVRANMQPRVREVA